METTLSKDITIDQKQYAQALEFQKLTKSEFVKLCPSGERTSYYTDLNNTTRFLIAREYKVPKALEMWKKWYDWRIKFKVDSLNDDAVAKELASGKAFWFGQDKENHPCLIVKVKRHDPKECSAEQNLRMGIYLLEEGIKRAEALGQSKVCVIWDREGWTKKNYDPNAFTMMKELSGVLQDFYAERLFACYILHPNWFMKAMFAVSKPFLSSKTRNKTKVIDKIADMLKWFTPDNLLVEHGGTSTFQYRYPPDAKPIVDSPSVLPSGGEEEVDAEFIKMVQDAQKVDDDDDEMTFDI